jgi:hypothetical protein
VVAVRRWLQFVSVAVPAPSAPRRAPPRTRLETDRSRVAHTVRNATVGGIRDARIAGIRPATAPIRMPAAHASKGITTAQLFEVA